MSQTQPVRTLKEAKYSFNPARNAWYCGKKPVDEEEVLIHLIRYAKSQNIQNAGEYTAEALAKARAAPELATIPPPDVMYITHRRPSGTTNTPANNRNQQKKPAYPRNGV